MSDNNTMNKILVIGSGSRDGIIGKNLIKSLQEKNIKVEKMMGFDFETLSDVNFLNIKVLFNNICLRLMYKHLLKTTTNTGFRRLRLIIN